MVALQSAIGADGYALSIASAGQIDASKNEPRDYLEIGAAFVILMVSRWLCNISTAPARF